jgi:hypothetical protein
MTFILGTNGNDVLTGTSGNDEILPAVVMTLLTRDLVMIQSAVLLAMIH